MDARKSLQQLKRLFVSIKKCARHRDVKRLPINRKNTIKLIVARLIEKIKEYDYNREMNKNYESKVIDRDSN
jgi:urease gamma subunit